MTSTTRALEIAAELERCDASMTKGEWEIWTSNSFRRITARGQQDGGVLSGTVQKHDRHPDLDGRNRDRDLAGIATLRNLAPEVAATIRGLVEECERMRAVVEAACGPYGSQCGGHFGQPRPTVAMIELAAAIDAYRRSKP